METGAMLHALGEVISPESSSVSKGPVIEVEQDTIQRVIEQAGTRGPTPKEVSHVGCTPPPPIKTLTTNHSRKMMNLGQHTHASTESPTAQYHSTMAEKAKSFAAHLQNKLDNQINCITATSKHFEETHKSEPSPVDPSPKTASSTLCEAQNVLQKDEASTTRLDPVPADNNQSMVVPASHLLRYALAYIYGVGA